MPAWFTALQPPVQAALISALVGLVTALFVAFLNPRGQRQLERLKTTLQQQLQDQKADYDRQIEQLRLLHQKEIEQFRSTLKRSESTEEAWQSYAFDARQNLYTRFEPLLFQLFEAAEGSYHRVLSLVRSSRQGALHGRRAWLNGPGYYLLSTIYLMFLPGAILRLMRQEINFVDLKLDPEIRIKYYLCRLYVRAFTDDFVFANKLAPKLPYDPDSIDQDSIDQTSPHYNQGLYVGHLETFIDGMIVDDGGRRRPMTYSEFESRAVNGQEADWNWRGPVGHIFLNFDFPPRQVMALMLLVHALISRLLLYSFVKSATVDDLKAALHAFCETEAAKNDLQWREGDSTEPFEFAVSYIEERLSWILPDYYGIGRSRV